MFYARQESQVDMSQPCGPAAAGYELSWFYNPFAPGYWRAIAIEHGYMRCEVFASMSRSFQFSFLALQMPESGRHNTKIT